MSEQSTNGLREAVAAWVESFGPLKPFAVSLPTTKTILGDKSRSGIYDAAGKGELVFVKDGSRTLCTVDSIVNYVSRMPVAQIKAPPPRKTSKTKSIETMT
ncbi:MAG: hypothetical protein ACLP19_18260 [Xanthobacteraceae bacterium]